MNKNNIIIVIDTSNYNSSYSEKVPFKAFIKKIYKNEILVQSLTTNKVYELYYDQILEYMSIKEIETMLDISKYGEKIN